MNRSMSVYRIISLFTLFIDKCYCTCDCGSVFSPTYRIARPSRNKVKAPLYPWMAHLTFYGEQHCGAAIIDKYYLLTAAHCFLKASKGQEVGIGVGCRSRKDLKYIYSRNYLSHPGFFIHGDTHYDDIAIITLKEPLVFNEQIGSICLPWRPKILVGETLISPGWGRVHGNDTDEHMTDTMMQSTVFSIPALPDRYCYRNALCLIADKGEGPCFGDSGGPIVFKEQGRYTLYGVISGGTSESTDEDITNTCKILTWAADVRRHLPWIFENTPKATYCRPFSITEEDDYEA